MTLARARLRVLSYNIHKGFNSRNSAYTLHRMRDEIRKLHPDLVFLQEVHGEHEGHRKRIKDFQIGSQFEYLAEEMWKHFSYGKNAVYTEGHHGNAILSKFPILSCENIDISSRYERRGILHALIQIPKETAPLHAICTHLGLFGWDRKKQLACLGERLKDLVPKKDKVIAAGDFNDWRKKATIPLERDLSLKEAFLVQNGEHAKTFPSEHPFLCLDRIYFRGFKVSCADRLSGRSWVSLSDHLPLWAEFT